MNMNVGFVGNLCNSNVDSCDNVKRCLPAICFSLFFLLILTLVRINRFWCIADDNKRAQKIINNKCLTLTTPNTL